MATKRHKEDTKMKSKIKVLFFPFCGFSCFFVAIVFQWLNRNSLPVTSAHTASAAGLPDFR